MSLALKSRLVSLAIWLVVMAALSLSLAWPSTGTENVAALAMVALHAYYALAVLSIGVTLSAAKGDDEAKRSKSLKALSLILKARAERSVFGRVWSFIDCATIAVLSAYAGMLFAALLYTFLNMVVRLQYTAATELADKTADAGANQTVEGHPGPGSIKTMSGEITMKR